MMVPGYPDRRKGHYFGTEIDEKWWKRYRKNKFFARGNGEYWVDDTAFYFRRYLTKDPLLIPFLNMVEVKVARSHAGRWLFGRRVVKLFWKREGLNLSSGFLVSQRQQETEAIADYLRSRVP